MSGAGLSGVNELCPERAGDLSDRPPAAPAPVMPGAGQPGAASSGAGGGSLGRASPSRKPGKEASPKAV